MIFWALRSLEGRYVECDCRVIYWRRLSGSEYFATVKGSCKNACLEQLL